MKMNGDMKPFILGLLTFAAASCFFSRQSIKQIKNKTSLDQYKNRLKEFFLEEDVNRKMQDMCEFMDHGINAEDAFAMIIQESSIERF